MEVWEKKETSTDDGNEDLPEGAKMTISIQGVNENEIDGIKDNKDNGKTEKKNEEV